ncbi:MAG: family 20 glycosylhydrolase, partial [Mucilaginibacter sp.]
RLQIKQYPQLTEPQNMQRNPGAYYSVEEMQDLIRFCRERYITLVPELDMPGHSAAFKRAFKVDMQSDSGMLVMKNIVKEFCATYPVKYLHIGGDEIKITNKNFLPVMLQYIHSLGKQTIGWSPGGNLDKATIRQLWMSAGAIDPHLKYIDSRNLYINHMDPLESVVSIFNRQIGDVDKETPNVLGATLCSWPDRNIIKQEDLINMNPVYPAMLTFAERSWVGGGTHGWNTTIQTNNHAFAEFEDRLIDQQKQYFRDLPFQYVRQSGIKWKLFGPYANKGKLDDQFPPETNGFDPDKAPHQSVTGGTIILRHFWYPVVSAALSKPADSTTYYAFAKVWSDRDTTGSMWIGFYNISRSVPTSTPALGTWDDRHSKLWINGQPVAPYHWARAGRLGNIEKPLVDEGYEYRKPTEVNLHQGWNTVLVKLPVGSFRAGVSQNPVKWMFTAVFVKPLGKGYVIDDGLRLAEN